MLYVTLYVSSFLKELNNDEVSNKGARFYLPLNYVKFKVSEYPQKLKNLKTTFSWFTVFLFDQNEGEMCFLTTILFLNEI